MNDSTNPNSLPAFQVRKPLSKSGITSQFANQEEDDDSIEIITPQEFEATK